VTAVGPAPDAAAPPPQTLPKLRRLTKRAEFLHVAQGSSAARGAVMIQRRPRAGAADMGVGFTATKKIGGAVVRNRAKRRLREAARALLPLHGEPGHDYVFVARAGTPARPWDRLVDDVKSALISLAAGGDPPRPQTGPSRPPGARNRPRPAPPPSGGPA
jgi:ribonuclease P protein component